MISPLPCAVSVNSSGKEFTIRLPPQPPLPAPRLYTNTVIHTDAENREREEGGEVIWRPAWDTGWLMQ